MIDTTRTSEPGLHITTHKLQSILPADGCPSEKISTEPNHAQEIRRGHVSFDSYLTSRWSNGSARSESAPTPSLYSSSRSGAPHNAESGSKQQGKAFFSQDRRCSRARCRGTTTCQKRKELLLDNAESLRLKMEQHRRSTEAAGNRRHYQRAASY